MLRIYSPIQICITEKPRAGKCRCFGSIGSISYTETVYRRYHRFPVIQVCGVRRDVDALSIFLQLVHNRLPRLMNPTNSTLAACSQIGPPYSTGRTREACVEASKGEVLLVLRTS